MDVVRGAVFKQKRVVGFKCARHTFEIHANSIYP